MKVSESAIESLPKPVQRCLRQSGVVGTTVPSRVRVTQVGRIRTSEASKWLRFRSRETYEVDRPGFEWRAALKIGPITAGRVTDSFSDGAGRMKVKLLGLIDVVDAAGPGIDQGSLLRWLNETMWFPASWVTDVIRWTPADDDSAIGAVTVGDLTVSARFVFSDGRLVDFHADRHRDLGDGDSELTPWSTPIREHANLADLELPAYGAGVWTLPDGDFEYIQIRATEVEYDYRSGSLLLPVLSATRL